MIPFFKRVWHSFFESEEAFVGWIRGLVLAVGGSGAVFADQIGAELSLPAGHWFTKAVKLAAIGCLFIAGNGCLFLAGKITAGQKNP